jgi:hypothetical protein
LGPIRRLKVKWKKICWLAMGSLSWKASSDILKIVFYSQSEMSPKSLKSEVHKQGAVMCHIEICRHRIVKFEVHLFFTLLQSLSAWYHMSHLTRSSEGRKYFSLLATCNSLVLRLTDINYKWVIEPRREITTLTSNSKTFLLKYIRQTESNFVPIKFIPSTFREHFFRSLLIRPISISFLVLHQDIQNQV